MKLRIKLPRNPIFKLISALAEAILLSAETVTITHSGAELVATFETRSPLECRGIEKQVRQVQGYQQK